MGKVECVCNGRELYEEQKKSKQGLRLDDPVWGAAHIKWSERFVDGFILCEWCLGVQDTKQLVWCETGKHWFKGYNSSPKFDYDCEDH